MMQLFFVLICFNAVNIANFKCLLKPPRIYCRNLSELHKTRINVEYFSELYIDTCVNYGLSDIDVPTIKCIPTGLHDVAISPTNSHATGPAKQPNPTEKALPQSSPTTPAFRELQTLKDTLTSLKYTEKGVLSIVESTASQATRNVQGITFLKKGKSYIELL